MRPQQPRRTVAVARHADHSGAAHARVHLEPVLLQTLGDRRGPVLLVGQLRMLMQGAAERLRSSRRSSRPDSAADADDDMAAMPPLEAWSSHIAYQSPPNRPELSEDRASRRSEPGG